MKIKTVNLTKKTQTTHQLKSLPFPIIFFALTTNKQQEYKQRRRRRNLLLYLLYYMRLANQSIELYTHSHMKSPLENLMAICESNK